MPPNCLLCLSTFDQFLLSLNCATLHALAVKRHALAMKRHALAMKRHALATRRYKVEIFWRCKALKNSGVEKNGSPLEARHDDASTARKGMR